MSSTPSKPTTTYERPPYMVTLGLLPPYTAEDVEKGYLAKIKEIRPDLGGDREAFYAVQQAYVEAQEYVKFRGDRRGWIAKRMDEYLAVQEVIARLAGFEAQVETDSVDWLQKSFGDFAELTESVQSIRLNDALNGDEFVEYIVNQHQKLLELRRLDLSGCVVSDGAIRQLGVFRRLAELELNRTPITWEALHVIKWLPELDTIGIEGTGLKWFTRHRLASQMKRRRKERAALRAVHPSSLR